MLDHPGRLPRSRLAADLDRLPEQIRQPWMREVLQPGARLQPERLPRGFRRDLDHSVGVQDGDHVGQAVQRLLDGSLASKQFRLVGAPEFAQGGRHVVERLRKPSDFVPRCALDHQVEIPPADLLRREDQAGDGPEDPSPHEIQEGGRQGRRGKEHDVHPPLRHLRLAARPKVHRHHVFLVHPLDPVRGFLYPPGQGKQPGEVGVMPGPGGRAGITHGFQNGLVLTEELPQEGRLLPLAGQGDVPQLPFESPLEARLVRRQEILSLLAVPENDEDGPAVHTVQRLLHLQAGEHALVILPEHDVDGAAQLPELENAVDADRRDDQQKAAESQGEFLAERHVPLVIPHPVISMPSPS